MFDPYIGAYSNYLICSEFHYFVFSEYHPGLDPVNNSIVVKITLVIILYRQSKFSILGYPDSGTATDRN